MGSPDELHHAWQGILDGINRGAEIPALEAADLKRFWELTKDLPPSSGIGLGAMAGSGLDLSAHSPEWLMALSMRHLLLKALIDRQVIAMPDEESREKVFSAAANIPCDKEDLGEALARLQINLGPEETAAKLKEELRAAGYDPEQPKVDRKFLEWMKG